MKKFLVLFFSTLLFLAALAGCSGQGKAPKAGTPSTPGETNGEPAAATLKGELCEGEGFSIIAPEGWKVLELTTGGIQLYKSSGEAIQVQFAGLNQPDDYAQRQAEGFAARDGATEAMEVEMLGKKFWAATYPFSDTEQTFYARIDDGVMLSIQTSMGNYENNKEYAAILDSIVFK